MIQTKKEETYVKGTEQKTGLIWVDIDMISFLNREDKIIVYFKIGEKVTTFVDEINEKITSYPILESKNISYSQAEIKTLIEAISSDLTSRANNLLIDEISSDFTSRANNLLIDEINNYVEAIILNDIKENPAKYYGLNSDLWEKV